MPQNVDLTPLIVLASGILVIVGVLTQIGTFAQLVADLPDTWAKLRGQSRPGTPLEQAKQQKDQLSLATEVLHDKVKGHWATEAPLEYVTEGEMQVAWRLDLDHIARQMLDDHAAKWRLEQWQDSPEATVDHLAEFFLEQAPFGSGSAVDGSPPFSLVILGDPASGKSAASVLLAQGLLEKWQRDQPVAVHFILRRWGSQYRDRLFDWLSEQLALNYPMLRSKKYGQHAARTLLEEGRILPILEGFDEMHEADRSEIIIDINKVAGRLPGVVLTSRPEEYASVGKTGLRLPGRMVVITLMGIQPAVARAYLERKLSPEVLSDWEPLFDSIETNPSSGLATAMSSPLKLFLAWKVYTSPNASSGHPDELLDKPDEEISEYLLRRFVPAVSDPPWDAGQAQRWLGYLAGIIGKDDAEIAWWELSSYGGSGLTMWARLTAGVIAGAAVGASFYVLFGTGLGLAAAGVTGASFFWATGRRPALPKDLDVKWTRHRLMSMARSGLAIGLIILIVGTIFRNLEFGATWSLFGVLIGVLYGRLGDDPDAQPADPLYLLQREKRVGLAFGLSYGLIAAVIGFAVSGNLAISAGLGVLAALAGGLLQGPVWWISGRGDPGVTAYGNLLLATFYFAWKGKLPIRLMGFLDEAHARGVLRAVGGKYQYRHPLLQRVLRESVGDIEASAARDQQSPQRPFWTNRERN